MGKYLGTFGDFGGPKQKGIVTYGLSPFEQRVFANFFKKGFYSVLRRVTAQVPYIMPAVVLYYCFTTYGDNKYDYLQTKKGKLEAGVVEE